MRHLPFIATLVLAALAWASVPLFYSLDLRLPDGDAVGHLGAIELHLLVLKDRGAQEALRQAFTAGGEYPPLFALIVALAMLPFRGAAPFPGGLPVALGGLWALTLLGTALLGRERARHGPGGAETAPWAGFLAALILAISPLALALFRQPMPEPTVGLFLVYMAWALERSRGFERAGPAILAGIFAAAGLLTKQTFALYALPLGCGALMAGITRGGAFGRLLGNVSLFSLFAFPLPVYWLMGHLEDQQAYLAASAATSSLAGGLDHVLYYPLVVGGQGLGFGLALLALGAGIGAYRARVRGGATRWGWLGALLILTLIPKKYPRMIVPLLPLLAADLGASAVRGISRGRGVWSVLVVLGLIVGGAQSLDLMLPSAKANQNTRSIWVPKRVRDLDPNCFQQWVRPPHILDPGLGRIHQRLRASLLPMEALAEPPEGQGRILFTEAIPVPCAYQTTFSYARHLETYTRRHGIDSGMISVAQDDPEAAQTVFEGGWLALVLTPRPWRCDEVHVPAAEDELYVPPIEERYCPWLGEYIPRGTITSEDPDLPFNLYIYERKQEFR